MNIGVLPCNSNIVAPPGCFEHLLLDSIVNNDLRKLSQIQSDALNADSATQSIGMVVTGVCKKMGPLHNVIANCELQYGNVCLRANTHLSSVPVQRAERWITILWTIAKSEKSDCRREGAQHSNGELVVFCSEKERVTIFQYEYCLFEYIELLSGHLTKMVKLRDKALRDAKEQEFLNRLDARIQLIEMRMYDLSSESPTNESVRANVRWRVRYSKLVQEKNLDQESIFFTTPAST